MITYTLNEDIRVRVDWTGRLTPPVESYIVTYSIYAYKKNNYQIPIDGEYETIPFFVGSAYIPAGQTYLDLCINDIVGFQRWIPKFIHKEANDGHSKSEEKEELGNKNQIINLETRINTEYEETKDKEIKKYYVNNEKIKKDMEKALHDKLRSLLEEERTIFIFFLLTKKKIILI